MSAAAEASRPLRAPALPLSDPLLWTVIVAAAIVASLWGPASGISAPGFLLRPLLWALTLLAFAAFCSMWMWGRRAARIAETWAAWIVFTAAGCPISYFCARTAHPLIDSTLVAVDRQLGFDWSAWTGWVEAHHALDRVLHLAYASLPFQLAGAVCLLPLFGDGRRGFLLLRQAIVALAITCMVFWMFPARAACATLPGICNADWLPHLEAMRNAAHPALALSLPQMKGIVSLSLLSRGPRRAHDPCLSRQGVADRRRRHSQRADDPLRPRRRAATT